MKLVILLLSILAVSYTQSVGGYQELDVVEAQNSPEILNLIQFGLDAIIQNAVKKGFFTNTNFVLTKVNSVEEQVVNGENYRFNCEFADDKGVKIEAKFVVFENPTKTIRTVMSYSYKVFYPSTPVPGNNSTKWTRVTPSEFKDAPELNGLFQLGLRTVLGRIVEAGKVPEGSVLTHAKILSIYKRAVKNGEVYKFNCTTTNQVNITVNLTFQVVHQVRDFDYNVEILPPPTNPDNSNNPDNSTDPTTPTNPDNSTNPNPNEPTNPTNPDNSTDPTTPTNPDNSTNPNPTEPGNNNTNTTTPPAKVYEQLDLSLIDTNSEIKKALDFGVAGVLQKGHEQGKIPESDYSVTERISLVRLNLTNGLDYIFTVRLANSAKTVRVFTNFTVYVRYSTGAMTLPAYYYYYSIDKDFEPQQPNNGTNTTIPGNNTNPVPEPGNGNTTNPVPEPGTGNNSTNTTEPETGSGSNNGTNTTTPTPPTNSTSDYVEVDDNEIATSQEIQNVLNFGINNVTQTGIKQGKVPDSQYTISQVESVTRKTDKGSTYKCKVSLVNAQNVKLNMSFTVAVDPKTQELGLRGYSYKVTGIKVPSSN